MKKVMLTSNAGWIIAVVLFIGYIPGCLDGSSNSKEFKSCADCSNDNFSGLNYGELTNGISNYKKYQWPIINDSMNKLLGAGGNYQDARSCWYSLASLKHFMCLVEKYSVRAGLDTSNLGIRFYYATYGDSVFRGNSADPDFKKQYGPYDYSFHHTLFMVPTNRQHNLDIDFDPKLTLKARFPGITFEEIMSPKFKKSLGKNDTAIIYLQQKQILPAGTPMLVYGKFDISDPGGQNQGKLCPPTCDPGNLNQ